MLNKSVHVKPDDTTTNPTQEYPPAANFESTPSHEVPFPTVRLVVPPLDFLPPSQVLPSNPNSSNSLEDLSPRDHEGNKNQDSPHVRFRSLLASGVEPSMTNFSQGSDVDYPPGHPDL